jgi:Rrf2 family protein
MISQRARYALKALLFLARAEPGRTYRASEIAAAEGIPEAFLEAILVDLRRSGLLASRRGRAGGHMLAHAPEKISLAAVLRATEGPVAPVSCLSRTAYRRCADCADEETCDLRHLFLETHAAMLGVLERRSLADVVKRSHVIDEFAPGFFEGAHI